MHGAGKERRKEGGGGFVAILLTWAAHLPQSSAGAWPAPASTAQAPFGVGCISLAYFPPGWWGLALIKGSSLRIPPQKSCWFWFAVNPVPVEVATGDGVLLSKINQSRGERMSGGEDKQEEKEGDVWEERATVSLQWKQKRKQRRGGRKITAGR